MAQRQRFTWWRRSLGQLAAVACLAGLSLTASASPATGSVSIGQISPVTPSVDCAGTDVDNIQPSVTSGATYLVPPLPPASALVINSWSTNAAAGTGQMLTMKVFRKVADPATYTVVGHDGPRPLTASTVNKFQANVPVQPGDILGLNSSRPAMTACAFSVPGENRLIRIGNLADGQSGPFAPASPDRRTNISAVVAPSNSFSLGGIKRRPTRGTATLKVEVPNPGTLVVTGKGMVTVSKQLTAAGVTKLKIRAKGQKRRRLKRTGTVKVKPKVTYTPTGGDPNAQSRNLRLKKRR